jgi:hypothetical protein
MRSVGVRTLRLVPLRGHGADRQTVPNQPSRFARASLVAAPFALVFVVRLCSRRWRYYTDPAPSRSSAARGLLQSIALHGSEWDQGGDLPDEAAQLAGDRGVHLVALLAHRRQVAESGAQPQLRLPGNVADFLGQVLLALEEMATDRGWIVVRPRRFTEHAAHVHIAALGDASLAPPLAGGVLGGENDGNVPEEMKRTKRTISYLFRSVPNRHREQKLARARELLGQCASSRSELVAEEKSSLESFETNTTDTALDPSTCPACGGGMRVVEILAPARRGGFLFVPAPHDTS